MKADDRADRVSAHNAKLIPGIMADIVSIAEMGFTQLAIENIEERAKEHGMIPMAVLALLQNGKFIRPAIGRSSGRVVRKQWQGHLMPALYDVDVDLVRRFAPSIATEPQDSPMAMETHEVPDASSEPDGPAPRKRRGTRRFDPDALLLATLKLIQSGASEVSSKTLRMFLDGWDDARISTAARRLLDRSGRSFKGQPLRWLNSMIGDPDALRGMMTAGSEDGDFSPDIEFDSRLPE